MRTAASAHAIRPLSPPPASAPANIDRLVARAGIERDAFTLTAAGTARSDALPPPRPPVTQLDAELESGARSFTAQLETLLGSQDSIDALNADMLLAAFLKLNISDPNNTVETQNELHELASNLREMALREAQKRAEVAHEMAREAENAGGYAAMAMQLSVLVGIAGIFTGGIVSMLAGIMQGVAQGAKAVEDLEIAEKMLDSQQMELLADRARNHAEHHQEQIENEAEGIRTLFELKNQVVDRMLSMMEQGHTTRVRVMSVAFAY